MLLDLLLQFLVFIFLFFGVRVVVAFLGGLEEFSDTRGEKPDDVESYLVVQLFFLSATES